MTKIVTAEESSLSFRYTTERHIQDMTETAARTHIEVAKSQVEVARTHIEVAKQQSAPARWASVAVFGCVAVLVVGILGVLLLTADWRIAVAAVIAIAGMGGYILKGPLNKLISAVADSIGSS